MKLLYRFYFLYDLDVNSRLYNTTYNWNYHSTFAMIHKLILFFLLAVYLVTAYEYPVIGVLTQELLPSLKETYPGYNSFVAASYVKAVEGSGARVVPILIKQNEDYYRRKLATVNGVVYPGGSCLFDVKGGYAEAGATIYRLAVEANLKGDHFPILGVCLGFELLLHIANKEQELRTHCRSKNVGLPLKFLPGFRKSRLYERASIDILTVLSSLPVTSNHHRYCITVKNMTSFGLSKQWKILSLNTDENNLVFVSSVEERTMPFAGIQFHPEKNAYEWEEIQHNPHSEKAIASARIFYDWLIHEARRNEHKYSNITSLQEDLIDNFSPFFTSKKGFYYEQVYLFP